MIFLIDKRPYVKEIAWWQTDNACDDDIIKDTAGNGDRVDVSDGGDTDDVYDGDDTRDVDDNNDTKEIVDASDTGHARDYYGTKDQQEVVMVVMYQYLIEDRK